MNISLITGQLVCRASIGVHMRQICLEDPLNAVRVCTSFADELGSMGYEIQTGTSLVDLSELKRGARNEGLSPFFDPEICNLTPDRIFWLSVSSRDGKIAGLQAFRFDQVETSLADWGPSYIIGLYMRRQEMLVPTFARPPKGSIAENIRGRLAYSGEFWVDPQVRNRRFMECFSRLGIVLSHIKWNLDSVWGICSNRMAVNGLPNRMGFAHLEKGFLAWQWSSEGIDPVEWLAISERTSIERMINETTRNGDSKSQPEKLQFSEPA